MKGFNSAQAVKKCMGTERHVFTTVAEKIGYGVIAERAGVSYQAVSRFANNPVPTHKYKLRGRVLDCTIDELERRRVALKAELGQIGSQIDVLKEWKEKEFVKA